MELKRVIGDRSSSQSEEKKTMGGSIFSSTRHHNIPHEFHSTSNPTAPKFLIPKEDPNIQLELATMEKEWDKLDEDCKQSVPFDQYFLVANKIKKKEDNRYIYQQKELNCSIGKFPLPTFDGSSQIFANTWVQKLDVSFQLNPMVEKDAIKMAILHLEEDSNEWWFHGLKNLGHD